MPQNQSPSLQIWKKGTDSRQFDPLVMRPATGNYPENDLAQMQSDTGERAHNTAAKAGGFLTTKERKGRSFGGGPVDSGT